MTHVKPKRYCPTCNHEVEFDRLVSGGAVAYRCCNCWAQYTERELAEMSSTPKRRESDHALPPTHR